MFSIFIVLCNIGCSTSLWLKKFFTHSGRTPVNPESKYSHPHFTQPLAMTNWLSVSTDLPYSRDFT